MNCNLGTMVVRNCAILAIVGSPLGAHIVVGQELHAAVSQATTDGQIATLLSGIETALMNGSTISMGLSEKLIAAKTLWPAASPDGRRMLKNFPARLTQDGARLPEDDAKALNLKTFGDVAAQYITNTTFLDERQDERPDKPAQTIQDKPTPQPDAIETPPVQQITIKTPEPPQQVAVVAPPPVAAPAPPPVTAAPPSPLADALRDRGDAMVNLGDVSAARLLYERAAGLGSGSAAMKLANTYEADFISAHKMFGIKPDNATAAIWYRKAMALGEPQAEARLMTVMAHMASRQ